MLDLKLIKVMTLLTLKKTKTKKKPYTHYSPVSFYCRDDSSAELRNAFNK